MSYALWQRAVRDRKPVMASESDPQEGFYRVKVNGKFVPLAVWWKGPVDEETFEPIGDQKLVCMVGFDHDRREVDPMEVLNDLYCANWWVMAMKNPIPEAWYRTAMATGRWPDVDPIVDDKATEARLAVGGNQPPETDALKDQIAAATAGVKQYEKIATADQAAKAQTLRSHLNELANGVEKQRKALKQPYLDAEKAVDAIWMPLTKAAKAGADAIALALGVFFTEQDRKQKEEERKAVEAQRMAEEEARKAADEGRPTMLKPQPVPAPAPQPTQVRGGAGRAANITTIKVVVGITDQAALYEFMAKREELIQCLTTLAQRAVNAGHEVPGVIVEERKKVA